MVINRSCLFCGTKQWTASDWALVFAAGAVLGGLGSYVYVTAGKLLVWLYIELAGYIDEPPLWTVIIAPALFYAVVVGCVGECIFRLADPLKRRYPFLLTYSGGFALWLFMPIWFNAVSRVLSELEYDVAAAWVFRIRFDAMEYTLYGVLMALVLWLIAISLSGWVRMVRREYYSWDVARANRFISYLRSRGEPESSEKMLRWQDKHEWLMKKLERTRE